MRLAVLGADGSHAEDLIRLFNVVGRHPGVAVTHVCTDGSDLGATLARDYRLRVDEDPARLVSKVDAALVLSRDGGRHLPLAEPFLRAGRAVFVDKPMACSVADAEALIRLARRSGAALMSGSALRWLPATDALARRARDLDPAAIVTSGPVDPRSVYGGGFFYGVHAVELACELAARLTGGAVPQLVPTAFSSGCAVLTGRAAGLAVAVCLVTGDDVPFHGQVAGRRGVATAEIAVGSGYLGPMTDVFVDAVTHGRWPLAPEALLAPVRALQAFHEALDAQAGPADTAPAGAASS